MDNKKLRHEKYYSGPVEGQTILEVIISLAIIVVIMVAMLTQLKTINDGWASLQGGSEALQNGRVLVDHINRNLAKAARIIAVSESDITSGFIEFEDNNGDTYRYEISAGNMVQFGEPGVLYDLAGPVSNFQITCYDDNDLDTPLVIATDGVDGIRFVKVAVTVTNSTPKGKDKNFWASAYLRTNRSSQSNTLAHWKLDESSGLTAYDSSGNDYHCDLMNMSGDEWTTGIIDGGLGFDGISKYIRFVFESLDIDNECTLCAWVWHDAFIPGQVERYITIRSEIAVLRKESDGQLHFFIMTDGSFKHLFVSDVLRERQWHHVAGTWDGTTQCLYLDGVEVNSQTPGGVLDTPTFGGHMSSPPVEPFNGRLDDVRIYNCALTAQEVANLANARMFREFTEVKVNTQETSVTIDTPAGVNQNDLLIAVVANDGDTSSTLAPPVGEGWNEIDISNSSGVVSLGAWWKLADAAESGTHTFDWEGDHNAYAWMMRVTGHDLSGPIDAYATGNGTSATPDSPSVTVSGNSHILRIGAFENSDITVDDPGLADHTAITMDSSESSGSGEYGISVEEEFSFSNDSLVDGVSGQPTLTTNTIGNNKVLHRNSCIVNADILIGPGGDLGTVIRFQNPYDGQWNGTGGVLDEEVPLPSSIAEPGLGASIGDVTYSSGTTVINSDIHCDTLTINGTAIIQIDGDVTILVEGEVLIDDDAEIQLLAGATLNFYAKGLTTFTGNSRVNVNTADPARFRLYHIADYVIEKMMKFLEFSIVYAQMYGPTSYSPSCRNSSQVYGTFQGWHFKFEGSSRFHVDFGSAGGGGSGPAVSGGAGYAIKSSAGPSGTSNFALTGSNEFCTLTIGIKAAANDVVLLP